MVQTRMDPPEAGEPTAAEAAPEAAPRRWPFWAADLPYLLMLGLTVLGVAYVSFSDQPSPVYWEVLAPVFAVICIAAGWPQARTRPLRIRLVVTQLLHWGAIGACMEVVFLPHVRAMINADALGLAILGLLALGTFLAGVHAVSWRIGVIGLLMALLIPLAALIDQAALVLLVAALVALAIAVALLLYRRRHAAW